MDSYFERRAEINQWIIRARWFYTGGILLIGFLTKIISQTNVDFSFLSMILIAASFTAVNLGFFFGLKKIRRIKSAAGLKILGSLEIGFELAAFILVMHMAGGIDSIAPIFFFITIIASSLIFGGRGAIATAALSSLLINLLVIFEYFNIMPHIERYGVSTLQYNSLSITLTTTITVSVFYVIIGIFSGYVEKLLELREKMLTEKSDQLKRENNLRQKELSKLDRTAKLLVRRDLELTLVNNQLNENIKQMEEEKEKTLTLISSFSTPVIFLDSGNILSLFNPSAGEILGIKKSDLGKKIDQADNFSLNNFAKIVRNKFAVKKIEDQQNNLAMEEAAIKYQGEDRVYKIMTAKVTEPDGDYLGTMKIFYDTTREKTIDNLKSEFISIAAHQLRTPLSAIKWVIKMLLDGDAGALSLEQQELLNKGYKSNERIIRLVNDLLDVSRIEEGKFGFEFKKTDFSEVLSAAISSVEDLIKKSNLELTVEKPDKLPKIFLDKERMIMVMQNLLSNAVKYTPEYGKIKISIQFDTKFLYVKIKDQGVGIPKKELPKIFTKFFRATNVVRIQTEGTGLGLFIVKNIIVKHNGTISLKSEEGRGTEVSFSLPIKEIAN